MPHSLSNGYTGVVGDISLCNWGNMTRNEKVLGGKYFCVCPIERNP